MTRRSCWLRLYTGILDCRKIQVLSDRLFRVLVSLWCIAKDHDGVLPPVADIAWRLRATPERTAAWLRELQQAQLLDEVEPGCYRPHNWGEHQYESDGNSAEKTRRYRTRVRQAGCVVGAYIKHRDEVFERDGNQCVYCGATDNLCLDHMIPVALGGDDRPDNLACACRVCNSGKAGRTPEQAKYNIRNPVTMEAYKRMVTESELLEAVTVTDQTVTVTDYHAVTPRARAQSQSQSQSQRQRQRQTQNQKARARLSDPGLTANTHLRFGEFWERYPHKVGRDLAARAYVSVVNAANEDAMFDCLQAYEDSDEWARAVYQKPENWLFDRARSSFVDRPAPRKQKDAEFQRKLDERLREAAHERGIQPA